MLSIKSLFAPRILVFLPTPNEVQRFLFERAFSEVDQHFEMVYALVALDRQKYESIIREIEPHADLRFIEIDPGRMKNWGKLFKAACYQYAHKSRSFAIRVERGYTGRQGFQRFREDRGFFRGKKSSFSRHEASAIVSKPMTGANDPRRMFDTDLFNEFKLQTFDRLGAHQGIAAVLVDVQPVAVIVPTSLLDPFCNEVLWLTEERRLTSFIIQSGWDNLSSKGILFHKPDFVGVWGPQSRKHAVSIQGVEEKETVLLGAPHYEALRYDPEVRASIRKSYGIEDNRKLILFGGSFRQFDETTALRRIEEEIDRRGWNVTVLYRPHPYRLDRAEEGDFFETQWKHVIFDEEMRDRYRASKKEAGYIKRERPLYSMSYLAGVLAAVDAVISPMSTLLIEAMIMGRPTLAIAYSDAHHGYGVGSAAEMTHFRPLRKNDALIWCAHGDGFMADVQRLLERIAGEADSGAQTELLSSIVVREPGDYATRVSSFVKDKVVPFALRREEGLRQRSPLISHHYGADAIAKNYVGLDPGSDEAVPGSWMHGWLPSFYNRYPPLVATHRTDAADHPGRLRELDRQKKKIPQWVSRLDQVACLEEDGYRKVKAIGLPFAYLPPVAFERRSGSLLVMPPHGLKKTFDAALAEQYAEEIAAMRANFSEVVVCLTERDYYRGEWRPQFQVRGIPVIIGSGHGQPDALLRLKRILSTFEYVTSNAFGSQIAYAAHCGAKVSIYGSFCGWDRTRESHAVRMFPELADILEEVLSEEHIRKALPFLFVHPTQAETAIAWADEQVGLPWRRSREKLARLFGWAR